MATLKKQNTKALTDEEITKIEDEKVIESVKFADNDIENTEYEMLAGYKDDNGIIHKTFTLREITGRDEEAIQRADIKGNGSKVVNTLLTRCVTSIGPYTRKSFEDVRDWEKIIKSLFTADQDYMLLKLREISIGEEFELRHECPTCHTKLVTTVSSDELAIRDFDGEREFPFELPRGYKDSKGNVHKTGVMRLPNGFDREILNPIAVANPAKADTLLLIRCCKFDDGYPIDNELMVNLSIRDREYLKKLLIQHNFGVELQVEVTCDNCGTVFMGAFNPTNFL